METNSKVGKMNHIVTYLGEITETFHTKYFTSRRNFTFYSKHFTIYLRTQNQEDALTCWFNLIRYPPVKYPHTPFPSLQVEIAFTFLTSVLLVLYLLFILILRHLLGTTKVRVDLEVCGFRLSGQKFETCFLIFPLRQWKFLATSWDWDWFSARGETWENIGMLFIKVT